VVLLQHEHARQSSSSEQSTVLYVLCCSVADTADTADCGSWSNDRRKLNVPNFALFYISGGSCQTWEDQIVKQRPTMLKCHLVWSCMCWAPDDLKPLIVSQSTIQLCKWQRWPENCKLRAARCLLFKGARTSKRNLGNFPHCLRLVSRSEQA
jgi:hypothetical protein